MKGLLQIDGVDVGVKYNVAIVKGGLRAVMVLPSTKPPKYNDWQEEEGIEVDLSSPVLDSQEMTIPFVGVGPMAQPAAFVEMLATGGYHRFYCPKYGLSLNVRMTKVSTFTYDRYLTYFSVTFVQDALPTATELALLTPSNVGMVKASDDYLLDGKKFSDYGVRILRGTLVEAMKYADFKQPLTRNISTQQGTIYDRYNDYLRSKSRDFSIICLARAGSVSDLRKNLNCLLRDMIKPNERRLYITEMETEVSCFYKGCTVSDFSPEDVWLNFALTFTMTRPPRHFDDDILLEAESGMVITTETNDNAIDVDPI